MTPQRASEQTVKETYERLRGAAVRKQSVAAMYDGQSRLFCPHVLGRKAGQRHALVYQTGGGSNSRQPATLSGGGVWRCLAVEKLSNVELHADRWHSEPRLRRQTCMDEVDFDTDAQPGDDPRNGQ
jgi:hypothetical protein